MCHTQPEAVEHIISGCQTLAADQYLNRHKEIAAQLHLDIYKHYGIKVEVECWYQHKPEQVMENEKATIPWNSPSITDRHVPCNKPDIVKQEKKADRCQIIDVAIPSDYNIQKKAKEKMSKYVDPQIQYQRIWKKVEVIPVIIGATGIVDKNIKKYKPMNFLNNRTLFCQIGVFQRIFIIFSRTIFDSRDKLLQVYNMASSGLMKMLILTILYTHKGVSENVCPVILYGHHIFW